MSVEALKKLKTDVVIVGSGVSGLFLALNLPLDKNIVIVTKSDAEKSDSFLAQGGICVQRDDSDYDSFFEDTMRAGHNENNAESVDIMIRSSRAVIDELIGYGVEFERDGDGLLYTREGAHSNYRILYHKDETGKEITSKLLMAVKSLPNVTLIENYTMVDIIEAEGESRGIVGIDKNGEMSTISADYTVLATGGVGGLYKHSTNFPHLTADSLAICVKHGIPLKNVNYVQIHPTTLYTERKGRSFLISESVRGEGAVLLNSKGERFVNELLPRDKVTEAIYNEMKKEGTKHVWLSLAPIPKDEIITHFPHIYKHCLDEGYDVTKEPIPVVPAQHYFMGGIAVNSNSKTEMDRLYAVGETACNGVHGKNRLASNSLLESLVFAKRAAIDIKKNYKKTEKDIDIRVSLADYEGVTEEYAELVLKEIEKENGK